MIESRQLGRTATTVASVLLMAVACANGDQTAVSVGTATAAPSVSETAVLALDVRVLNSFPHDPEAFTQGLLWFDGKLYESTGLWGQSSIRRVVLETGSVEARVDLAPALFGEGLARIGKDLLQLTWRNERAIRYDSENLVLLSEHPYKGEGWGLCFDGIDLWRSDGTDTLTIHDPESLSERGQLAVRLRNKPVDLLNELECAEGWIYANVLNSDEIMRIDPATGQVMAVVDASGLVGRQGSGGQLGPLNGIAFRSDSQTFLLTGKRWSRVFEVVFVQADDTAG